MKPKTFWIGRDEIGYAVLGLKSKRYTSCWCPVYARLCVTQFHRVTGIRLKPGEKIRVKLVEVA